MKMQLKHFIEHHKDLEEGKYVTVTGWQGKKDAETKITKAIQRYNVSNLFRIDGISSSNLSRTSVWTISYSSNVWFDLQSINQSRK